MLNAPQWVYWLGMSSGLIGGFVLLWWVNARQFARRGPLGEQYAGYADLWKSRVIETVARVISTVMIALSTCFLLVIASRHIAPGLL